MPPLKWAPWLLTRRMKAPRICLFLAKNLLDGQFEECGLTLSELHDIEESLSKSLIALFHVRIKYPEEPALEKAG